MKWIITIEGVDGTNDVIVAAQRFVKALIKGNNRITAATFIRGADHNLMPDPLKWDTRKDDPKKPIYET